MRVLLVEDEPRLSATLSKGLKAEGFVVVAVGTGVEGLHEAIENSFDVVVLDIMLPGHSGYEVLRRMRAQKVWTPVLMLTAKDGEYDETDAFELGADDYLTKPFSFRILVARLQALVRRGAPERPVVLTAGSLSLDPTRHTVQRGSTPIPLTPREFGLLEFLIRNEGHGDDESGDIAQRMGCALSGSRQCCRGLCGISATQDRRSLRYQHY